ncbi:MAG: hypothetical protein IJI98_02605 [Methanosphaera sp.]|nr:hypothetical protein [Methanosphaera sp.]
MIEDFLSQLDSKQKFDLVKYVSIFAGGVLVGYSVKKILDSYDFDAVRDNAVGMVEDYVNPKIRDDSVEVELVDEEHNDE